MSSHESTRKACSTNHAALMLVETSTSRLLQQRFAAASRPVEPCTSDEKDLVCLDHRASGETRRRPRSRASERAAISRSALDVMRVRHARATALDAFAAYHSQRPRTSSQPRSVGSSSCLITPTRTDGPPVHGGKIARAGSSCPASAHARATRERPATGARATTSLSILVAECGSRRAHARPRRAPLLASGCDAQHLGAECRNDFDPNLSDGPTRAHAHRAPGVTIS